MKILSSQLRYGATPLEVRGGWIDAPGVGSLRDARSASQLPSAPEREEVSTPDLQAIRLAAHKEGWEQGRREGAAAAILEIRESAKDIIDAAVAEAVEKATSQAVRRVEASARDAISGKLEQLQAAALTISQSSQSVIQAAEDAVVGLVLDVTEEVFGAQAVLPNHVKHVVATAMEQLRMQKLFQVEVHADDLGLLRRDADWDAWTQAKTPQVEWVSSDRVLAGGCVLHTAQGSLDARLETQLESFILMVKKARQDVRASCKDESQAFTQGVK